MSDEEVMAFYQELVEYYGDRLANFEHHPKQFAAQIKVYRYYKTCLARTNVVKL